MGRIGILVETPTKTQPSSVRGMIYAVASYTIKRTINQGGSWQAAFAVSEPLGAQIETGWHVSLTEEGNDPTTYPGWILRRGKVNRRRYMIDPSGQAIIYLEGPTPLGCLTDKYNHAGLEGAGVNLAGLAAAVDPDDTFFVPSRTDSELITITFNDQTQLGELIRAAELFRTNLRERFDSETEFDFTDQLDVPDSGYRFMQVEASPIVDGQEVARQGIGIIASAPEVDLDGTQVVNRVTPVGTDWDGAVLTLQYATATGPYTVQEGTNPDSSPFWYLEDSDAVTRYGLIETKLVRSDIKNPNDPSLDAGASRTQAANALYMLGASALLQRAGEELHITVVVVNGDSIWALPGDRIHLRYVGKARMPDGAFTWLDIDSPVLVYSRTDQSSSAGIRNVLFTLTAQIPSLQIPSNPDAIPIMPPFRDVPTIQPDLPDDFDDDMPSGDEPGDQAPESPPPDFSLPDVPPGPEFGGPGAYQPCCADVTTDVNDVPSLPDDIGFEV